MTKVSPDLLASHGGAHDPSDHCRESEHAVVDGVRSAPPAFHVVGVGASAGGLEALEAFFEEMPADSGLAFVVVQHLSPDFKSLMDELLSRRTDMPIHRVEDGIAVKPNAVYLIPPKKEMMIAGGRLLLTDKDPTSGLSLPIDTFFRSLAQDVGDRAVGVILSGTGSDGSRGVRAIHEAGGLVVVQSELTAKFDGMPRSAIETGAVDLVLPPREIPQALLNHVEHPTHGGRSDPAKDRLLTDTGMNAVYRLLHGEFGIDFSHYKPNTILRRIDRRLQLNRSLNLDEYLEQLRNDRRELNLLYRDLLIGVTRFFRDPDLFDQLARSVIPQILARTRAEDEIRAWVAGCATGEEAYSLAILLHEALTAAKRPTNVKIFATDVHRASLEVASAGLYDESALAETTSERRDRYFVRQASGYQVSQDLRKLIVFAPHNVIKDAPFTKLDLVSCRNLLIYLQPHAQKKALSLFHFGLKASGVLVLGPSESPGDVADEFETLDSHWKVYRKRRDVRLTTDLRLPLAPLAPPASVGGLLRTGKPAFPDPNLIKAYDELLGAYVPPSFLVSAHRELLHTFAGAGRYLSVPDGRPSADLLDMVDDELRLAISGALQRAAKESVPVAYGGVTLSSAGDERLKVYVRPLSVRSTGESFFLISLEPELSRLLPPSDVGDLDVGVVSQLRLQELEEELRYTKENLQATVEEMETTNEELQATNEELVASNEELQSTNEELHSVNEELYTVNAEYQRKITELTELTDDMDHLLRSTDVGTIFLDRDLAIRKFTPKIAHAFRLLPQDVGRRIDNFAHNIAYDGLLDDVRRVLASGEPCERDVQDRFGEWFLLRILPYRVKDAVDGAVITLIGISRLKATEQQLLRMSKVFMDGADPIVVEDLAGKIIDLNHEAERAYGWSRDELQGQSASILAPDEEAIRLAQLRQQCRSHDSVRNVESVRRDRQGRVTPVLITMSLVSDERGEPAAIATIAKDITAQKRSAEHAQEAAKRRDQFLAMLSHELRNPLGAITYATHVLESDEADVEARRQACAVVARQSRQMARLLDDLLDVTRITQNKIHLRDETVDLGALAVEAAQVVEPLVKARGHELTLDLPDQPVYVAGDAARLLQVQENLLANAVKYTPSGGRIQLSLKVEPGEAALRVSDNGLGIPPEIRGKIFDLFVQGPDALGHADAGMGIGLTLVQSIVQLHRGRVAVRSEGPGRGSEFEVRLPLTERRPAPAIAATRPHDARRKVLLVEDNADSRDLLQTLLRMNGHDVRAVPDGVQGVDAILADAPDVALVDIGLPGIDGYEVARRVRRESTGKAVRLVALTGFGRAVDREAVFAAGFDEHLVKPVDPAELARVLHKPR